MKPKNTNTIQSDLSEDAHGKKNEEMFYQPIKDRYIDPFTDFGFKKLFGEECNKDLLLDFLNELLRKEEGRIVSISYLPGERAGYVKESRKAVFDIFCENEKGEKFIVELQKAKQDFFKDRTLFYTTFPITEQAIHGEWDFELKAVYTIAILNFVFDEDKNDPEKYRYDVMLTDIETHKIFYDKLTFIYLEMPKFNKAVHELKNHFEKWMYVIKNLNRLDDIPDELRGRIFEKLLAAAEIAKLTKEQYREYVDALNAYRDWNNIVNTAEREGEAKGIVKGKAEGLAEGLVKGKAEGLAEGEAKGKAEERRQIVMNCHQKGFSEEMIATITGLTIQEIKALGAT